MALSAKAQDTTSVATDAHTFASQPAATFTKAQGDSAYIKGDYASAIDVYETLLQQGQSAEVYYNLGNSYYKKNEIALAILNYERALLIQPGNGDIRANLEIARAKTVDKVTPIPEIFFVAWGKSLISLLSIDAWGKWGITFFLLMLAAFSLFFFSKQIRLKKTGFIVGCVSLLFTLCCNLFAHQQKSQLIENNDAIILSPSVTARSTPSESGTALFILHEGHKVQIKDDSMREWKEIRLEDGKVGWVPTSSLEKIYLAE